MIIGRILVAIMLAGVPALAVADPVTLIAVAMTMSSVTWVVVAGYALMAANAIYGAADARRKARQAEADARAAYNASLKDRTSTMLQADPPWRAVYGECRVGGDVIAEITTDKFGFDDRGNPRTKPDGLKHLVIRLADHQVQEIGETYISGIPVVALDSSGVATAGPTDAPWARKRRVVIPAKMVRFDALGNYAVPTVTGLASEVITKVIYSSTSSPTSSSTQKKPKVPLTISGMTLTGASANQWLWISYEVEISESGLAIRKHLGEPGQTADTYLMSVAPAQWTVDHRLDGKAYVVVTLDLEDSRFQSGPPQIDFMVKGRLCFDPRTNLTAWTRNNALITADYLMSVWGYGVDLADIDVVALATAADACDQVVPLTVGATTVNAARYTCDGLITTGQAKESVLNDLANSMAGSVASGVQWSIHAGAWSAPVMVLTDADLAGPIQIQQAGHGLEDAINGLRGSYIPAGDSSPVDMDPYINPVFVAADGQELWGDIQLPYTDNKARARNLARIRVEQGRLGMVVQYPAKMRAWPLRPGDRVQVFSAEYAWAGKLFRVTDWSFALNSAVGLVLQEDEPTVWDLADAATPDPAPNTGLPSPWATVAPVVNVPESGTAHLLSLADGTILPRVMVSWVVPGGAHMVGPGAVTEVRWSLVGDSAWHVTSVPSDAASVYLLGMVEDDAIVIGVRHINAMGIDSHWVHVDHTVIGESAPPSDMSGLTASVPRNGQIALSWLDCPDVDYSVTELRVGVDWATGASIFTGRANTFNWSPAAAGTYTVWGAHRDRTQHESALYASVTVTVTDADLAAAVNWEVVVESVNGTEFRPGQGTQTLLIAHVFRNGLEVTNTIPQADFRWRRVSIVDPHPPADDATWNSLYAAGYRQVLVNVDDVASRATFHCDILTP